MDWMTWNNSFFLSSQENVGEIEMGGKDKRRGILREAQNDGGGEEGSQDKKREMHAHQNISHTLWLFNFFFPLWCCQEPAPRGPTGERQPERVKIQAERKGEREFFFSSST